MAIFKMVNHMTGLELTYFFPLTGKQIEIRPLDNLILCNISWNMFTTVLANVKYYSFSLSVQSVSKWLNDT